MTRIARVRGVVFDLDGTLVDSYQAITESLNAARRSFGMSDLDEAAVRAEVGRGLQNLITRLVGADRVDAGVETFRQRYDEVYAEQTTALPCVEATLRDLRRRGYRLSVASNKPARFSGPILDVLRLGDLFDAVEGPDTAGVTKPEPGMIHRCVERMGLTVGEALYVGDMVLDAESGARAGVPVLLVPGGSSARSALERSSAPVLESFDRLLDWLPGPPRKEEP
jgi:phosphoglycolate phosphatase